MRASRPVRVHGIVDGRCAALHWPVHAGLLSGAMNMDVWMYGHVDVWSVECGRVEAGQHTASIAQSSSPPLPLAASSHAPAGRRRRHVWRFTCRRRVQCSRAALSSVQRAVQRAVQPAECCCCHRVPRTSRTSRGLGCGAAPGDVSLQDAPSAPGGLRSLASGCSACLRCQRAALCCRSASLPGRQAPGCCARP